MRISFSFVPSGLPSVTPFGPILLLFTVFNTSSHTLLSTVLNTSHTHTPPSSGRSPAKAPLQVWNLPLTQNLKCSNAHQTRTRPLGWSPKWHGIVFAEPNNQEVILPSMTTLSLRPPSNGIHDTLKCTHVRQRRIASAVFRQGAE